MYVVMMAVVQWLHVFLAIGWFGSILFTRVVLFPALRRLPAASSEPVLTAIRSGPAQMITMIMASGTVGLGIIRGITAGVLDRLLTPYGLTYLAAGIIGLAMVIWVTPNPLASAMTESASRSRLFGRLYVAGFPVIFTLMIAMRFGY